MLELLKYLGTTAISLYGYAWYKNYLDIKKERKTKLTTDYSSDYTKKAKVKPILDDIQYELGADRVQYWEFSNGEKTLSGHHLKKLSMFMESNVEGERDIASQFQFIPVKQFERNLDKLYESEHGYIVSNEIREYDELASLFAQYGISTILSVKIINEIGVWIGVLSVCFKEDRVINDGEVAFTKLQGARLSIIK